MYLLELIYYTEKQTCNYNPWRISAVIATDAECDMSLVMTVTRLTLSIKSFPLIGVNVYETLREVGEERGTGTGKRVKRMRNRRSGVAREKVKPLKK